MLGNIVISCAFIICYAISQRVLQENCSRGRWQLRKMVSIDNGSGGKYICEQNFFEQFNTISTTRSILFILVSKNTRTALLDSLQTAWIPTVSYVSLTIQHLMLSCCHVTSAVIGSTSVACVANIMCNITKSDNLYFLRVLYLPYQNRPNECNYSPPLPIYLIVCHFVMAAFHILFWYSNRRYFS